MRFASLSMLIVCVKVDCEKPRNKYQMEKTLTPVHGARHSGILPYFGSSALSPHHPSAKWVHEPIYIARCVQRQNAKRVCESNGNYSAAVNKCSPRITHMMYCVLCEVGVIYSCGAVAQIPLAHKCIYLILNFTQQMETSSLTIKTRTQVTAV